MNKLLPKFKNIIFDSKTLYNIAPVDDNIEGIGDIFPTGNIGGFGGGGGGTGGGGTGGGVSGTTSSNIPPVLSISPSGDQSMVTGTTLCLNASGVLAFPQEAETTAHLNSGCSATLTGTWVKNCGTNGAYDGEAFDSDLIYTKRPWQITARNPSLASYSTSPVDVQILLGVKTTKGYYFDWHLGKHCESTSHCDDAWIGSIRMITPDGVQTTLNTRYVEFNQLYRLRSDGNAIIWDYTTRNKWAYGVFGIAIPPNVGDFQFFVNAEYLNNTWSEIRTYKGSYQATFNPSDFTWTSDCQENLVVTGDKACYTPNISGFCKVCVSAINSEKKCVNILSAPLTLTPVNLACSTCSDSNTDCENIPLPTVPVISVTSPARNALDITWTSSVSFTNGLHYELNINNNIQSTLSANILINNLAGGSYNVSVRAIDDCGSSDWSNVVSITIEGINNAVIYDGSDVLLNTDNVVLD